jgi:lysophospholipase L1-like esterase
MERFPNGARVCFVGDSITHRGLYIAHIVAHYRKHFPDRKVEFYDCGISGGNLGNSIKIFNEDIAIYEPTHIVLMIGVNDSKPSLLADMPRSAERYEKLVEAYESYKKNHETFYQMTKERGIKLILCAPVPYDEYELEESKRWHGAYALVQGYAQFVKDFARERGIPFCDYHTAMTKAMQTESLYAPDGVHPSERGHYVMAKIFLASQGLTIDEEAPFPDDIKEWYDTVQKLRGVVATEYFMVKDYTELSDEDRIKIVHAKLAEAEAGADFGKHTEYFTNLMRAYVQNKSHQQEYIAKIKEFMKG